MLNILSNKANLQTLYHCTNLQFQRKAKSTSCFAWLPRSSLSKPHHQTFQAYFWEIFWHGWKENGCLKTLCNFEVKLWLRFLLTSTGDTTVTNKGPERWKILYLSSSFRYLITKCFGQPWGSYLLNMVYFLYLGFHLIQIFSWFSFEKKDLLLVSWPDESWPLFWLDIDLDV